MTSENIFANVGPSDKEKILGEVALRWKTVFVKPSEGSDDQILKLEASSYLDGFLTCRADRNLDTKPEFQKIIVQFQVSSEKYLVQTTAIINADLVIINMKGPLFQLHRRADFRLRLPKGNYARFKIERVNDKSAKYDLSVLDMSAGGCRLRAETKHEIKKGDEIQGQMLISGRDPILLKALVRHNIPDPESKKFQMLGVQFTEIVDSSIDRLRALMLDIYRDIFVKL